MKKTPIIDQVFADIYRERLDRNTTDYYPPWLVSLLDEHKIRLRNTMLAKIDDRIETLSKIKSRAKVLTDIPYTVAQGQIAELIKLRKVITGVDRN